MAEEIFDKIIRYGTDVIKADDFPQDFSAILCGHIHRHQVIFQDLKGNPLGVPVFFSGSIERTSFAEMHEAKGFMVIRIHLSPHQAAPNVEWVFHELPTRPMIQLKLPSSGLNEQGLVTWLKDRLNTLPANSVVKLISTGKPGSRRTHILSARELRAITPPGMVVQPQRPVR